LRASKSLSMGVLVRNGPYQPSLPKHLLSSRWPGSDGSIHLIIAPNAVFPDAYGECPGGTNSTGKETGGPGIRVEEADAVDFGLIDNLGGADSTRTPPS
jgi:hypothetical protein